MKWISLNDLCNQIWYSQDLIIKEEASGVSYNLSNSQLQSATYEHIRHRWVRSIGADEGKIIITII